MLSALARRRPKSGREPVLVWTVDSEGFFTVSEGPGLTMPGIPPCPVIGESAFEFFAGAAGMVPDLLRGLGGEEFASRLDVGARSFETHYLPLRDAEGRVRGLLAATMDVSDREGRDSATEPPPVLRSQRVEGPSQLGARIAHDVNNLLTVILGNTFCAARASEDNAEVLTYLENVRGAARRATALTRQLLAQSGTARVDVRRIDLSHEVRELAPVLAGVLGEQVVLDVATEEDLPLIELDAVELERVLGDLVGRAADALGDGGGTVQIRTRSVEVAANDAGGDAGPLEPGSYVVLDVEHGEESPGDAAGGGGFERAARVSEYPGLSSFRFLLEAQGGGIFSRSTPASDMALRLVFRAEGAERGWLAEAPSGVRGAATISDRPV